MLCFRDRTWCPYGDICKKANKCNRAFGASEHYQAMKWWGGEDYPVCFFNEKPECYVEKEPKDQGSVGNQGEQEKELQPQPESVS